MLNTNWTEDKASKQQVEVDLEEENKNECWLVAMNTLTLTKMYGIPHWLQYNSFVLIEKLKSIQNLGG